MLKPLPFLSTLNSLTPLLRLYPSTRHLFRLHSAGISSFHISRASSSFTKMDSESYMFGPYKINPKEVFYSTQFSYALVNLRPVVPGHILSFVHIEMVNSLYSVPCAYF
ncbi:hypothetical protein ACJIZ3_012389 [Penstemon smallii]|uniref:Bis(5'-adenosyl)-triphosphatase n=1 Tax=Penstemon smallii TaxID=265156 RepID=A0ABD3UQH1_9LAMI